MHIELTSLAILTLFFFYAWLPASIAKRMQYGRSYLLSNRDAKDLPELHPWGERSNRAYENLKSYFPAFAVAVLSLVTLGISDDTTKICAIAFVVARIAHFTLYSLGFVKGRALAWAVSMIANTILLIKIFI